MTGSFPGQSGTVTFTPPQEVTDLTGTIPVLGPASSTYALSGGTFTSGPLLCTDNLGLLPVAWTWTVTVALTGQRPYYYPVLLPSSPSVVSLADVSSSPVQVPSPVDWINAVEVFDADPTGSSPADAAINAALNAAPIGGVVYIPAGTYQQAAPIIIPPQVTLLGSHSSHIDSTTCCFQLAPGFTGAASILMLDQATGGYPVVSNQQSVRGITIDGSQRTGSAVDGIQAQGFVHSVILEDIQIRQMTGHGLAGVSNSSGVPYSWRGTRLGVYTCASHGYSVTFTDCTWIDLEAIGNLGSGFNLAGAPANTHFVACRAEYNLTGYNLTGTWGEGTGTGGCVFTGCSTDGNIQDGVFISATGSVPVLFEGLMARRDGANGLAGGAGYAGFRASASNLPVVINGITVLPGIALTGGANSPQYGFAAVSSAANVTVQAASLHAATAAWHDDGSNTNIMRGPNVIERVGTTSSFTTAYNALQSTDTGVTFVNPSTAAVTNLLAPLPVASAMPSTALAETIPRWATGTSAFAMSSGILYISEVTLGGGQTTAGAHWVPGSTGAASPSHWWYVLLDHTFKVVAVTADQLTAVITASTDTPLSWAASYTAPATGTYYLGVMVNAGVMPTGAATSATYAGSLFTAAPIGGESSLGQTTAPAVGTTMATPSVNTQIMYQYLV